MKIAIITDLHFGAREGNRAVAENQRKFYEDFFFPFVDANDIKRVFCLGDTFDKRKHTEHVSLHLARAMLFDPMHERNIPFDIIVGNHDIPYKNTTELNSIGLLLGDYDNITGHSEPTEIEVDGTKILMMPWICSGNYGECMESIQKTQAQILFGHLEVAGFEMYKGAPSEHGYSPDMFSKFDIVLSGHFHHKSTRGNISYLGAPYEMTWSDYNDPRGFHVFDTDTRELTFYQNPHTLFLKQFYDDSNAKNVDAVNLSIDEDRIKDSFVKIVVKSKLNPYWFDLYLERIESFGPTDVQIVDDHLNLSDLVDGDIVDEAEDTLTIIQKFADQASSDPVVTADLRKLLSDIYLEALRMETDSQ